MSSSYTAGFSHPYLEVEMMSRFFPIIQFLSGLVQKLYDLYRKKILNFPSFPYALEQLKRTGRNVFLKISKELTQNFQDQLFQGNVIKA